MIIDTHIHCFPDAIAKRAVENVSCGIEEFSRVRGNFDEMIENMDRGGVDKGFFLNVATNPHQTPKVNAYSLSLNRYKGRIYSFGSVHPDCENIPGMIEDIKNSGLHGLKLHPDYQGYYINDEKYAPIFKTCAALRFPIILHCGFDPKYPDDTHATPKMIREVIDRYPELVLVCAHLSSNGILTDDVLKYICGQNVWLDTAFCVNAWKPENAKLIIENHDINKIMFGSDTPWETPKATADYIRALGFSESANEKIFHENAENFMKLYF